MLICWYAYCHRRGVCVCNFWLSPRVTTGWTAATAGKRLDILPASELLGGNLYCCHHVRGWGAGGLFWMSSRATMLAITTRGSVGQSKGCCSRGRQTSTTATEVVVIRHATGCHIVIATVIICLLPRAYCHVLTAAAATLLPQSNYHAMTATVQDVYHGMYSIAAR